MNVCVNVCVNVNCDCKELRECNSKKMYVYVPPCNSMLTCLAVMCIIVICKCLSQGSDQQQDLSKPSQAINGKLLNVLSDIIGEKTQSALRRKQGLTHLLWCYQHLATQVSMKQSVN